MKFKSADEMYHAIVQNDVDLYNPENNLFVFHYDENGSIATYDVLPKEAVELETASRENQADETWSSQLGAGGYIYEKAEAVEFCRDNYDKDGWMSCRDVLDQNGKPFYTKEILQEDLDEKKNAEKKAPVRAEKHMNRGGIEL